MSMDHTAERLGELVDQGVRVTDERKAELLEAWRDKMDPSEPIRACARPASPLPRRARPSAVRCPKSVRQEARRAGK